MIAVAFLTVMLIIALVLLLAAAGATASFLMQRDSQRFRPTPRPRLRRGHSWY